MEQIKISKHLMIRARLRLTLAASAENQRVDPPPPTHPDQEGVLVKDEIPSEMAPKPDACRRRCTCRWRARAGEVEQPLTHSLMAEDRYWSNQNVPAFLMVLLGSQVLVGG